MGRQIMGAWLARSGAYPEMGVSGLPALIVRLRRYGGGCYRDVSVLEGGLGAKPICVPVLAGRFKAKTKAKWDLPYVESVTYEGVMTNAASQIRSTRPGSLSALWGAL